MRAVVQEMRSRVVEAEAEVPKAIAQALREGKFGVLDYQNLRNLMADTDMRDAISRLAPKGSEPTSGPTIDKE